MKIININSDKIKNIMTKVANVIYSGGVVVHPTDTCYGMAADIYNKEALKKVYDIKKRDHAKPINIVVKNIEDFKRYGEWNLIIDNFLKLERMHSFVVRKTNEVPDFFNKKFNNIGIQIPRYLFSREMLKTVNYPLAATSANISGKKPVYDINDFILQIKKNKVLPDLIIDAGVLPGNKPSKLIEIISDNEYKILRN